MGIILPSIAGQSVGEWLVESSSQTYNSWRRTYAERIRSALNEPTVLRGLFQHAFRTRDSDFTALVDIVQDTSWIIIIEPNCPACNLELGWLRERITEVGAVPDIVFIVVSPDPVALDYLWSEFGDKYDYLQDDEGMLVGLLDTLFFPLNIKLSSDQEVLSVWPGVPAHGYGP